MINIALGVQLTDYKESSNWIFPETYTRDRVIINMNHMLSVRRISKRCANDTDTHRVFAVKLIDGKESYFESLAFENQHTANQFNTRVFDDDGTLTKNN